MADWDNEYLSKKQICNRLREISYDYGKSMSIDKESAVHRCSDALMLMPAADVVEVVHAEWDSDERCTACGEKSTEGLDAEKWNYWLPDYCPHCGAKMDL